METKNLLGQQGFVQAEQTADLTQNVQQNKQAGLQHDKQNIYDCNAMTITVSMRLMHYLFKEEKEQKNSKKMTKAQAFYDLLAKQQLAELTEDLDWVNRGIMQLAKSWGWNRPTVNAFIDRLIEEKAALSFPYQGKNIILLSSVNGLPDNISRKLMIQSNTRRSDQSRPDAQEHRDKPHLPSSPDVDIQGHSEV